MHEIYKMVPAWGGSFKYYIKNYLYDARRAYFLVKDGRHRFWQRMDRDSYSDSLDPVFNDTATLNTGNPRQIQHIGLLIGGWWFAT